VSGIIHYGYYVCWYMLCNTDGKYTKQINEHGGNVSISNLNYRFIFSLSHIIIFYYDLSWGLQHQRVLLRMNNL
jgi:hypothetical protein